MIELLLQNFVFQKITGWSTILPLKKNIKKKQAFMIELAFFFFTKYFAAQLHNSHHEHRHPYKGKHKTKILNVCNSNPES